LRRASLRAPRLPPQGRGRYPLALAGQDRPIQRSAHRQQDRDLPRYRQRSPAHGVLAWSHAPARTDRHARNQLAGARHTAAGTEPARPNAGLGGGSDNDGRTPGYGTPASTGTHACARVITCTSSVAATASAHRPTDVHIRMICTHLPHRRFSWSPVYQSFGVRQVRGQSRLWLPSVMPGASTAGVPRRGRRGGPSFLRQSPEAHRIPTSPRSAGDPHRNPTDETELPGTPRHGCYDGLNGG